MDKETTEQTRIRLKETLERLGALLLGAAEAIDTGDRARFKAAMALALEQLDDALDMKAAILAAFP